MRMDIRPSRLRPAGCTPGPSCREPGKAPTFRPVLESFVNPGRMAIDIEGLVRVAPRAGPLVGIIANPVSARDIRRVVANASSLQITDRANFVLRVLACLRACGIRDVL